MHTRDVPAELQRYDLVPPIEIFALPQQGMNNTNVGVRTAQGDFILRTALHLHDRPALDYEHRLLHWLTSTGLTFAVPVPIPTRDGEFLADGPRGWTSLTRRLPGNCLDPTQPQHIELLGAVLGELHVVLQRYPCASRPGRPLFGTLFDFPQSGHEPCMLRPVQVGLPDEPPFAELLQWWWAEASQLQAFVATVYRTLPWQLCHNDVTPMNVLVHHGQVSGVLDWEFATPAPRALDVAMGLRMVMRVWENADPWEVVRLFCQSYTRSMRLTEAEVQALPQLMRLRGAITVLWWLGRSDPAATPDLIASRIGFLRNFVAWLAQYKEQLVAILLREMA